MKPLGEEAELEDASVVPRGFQGRGDLGPPSSPTFLASLFAPQYTNYFKYVPHHPPPCSVRTSHLTSTPTIPI